MEATSIKENKTAIHARGKINLLPVAVFYGANSSGKSNVIRAIMAMKRLVLRSVRLNPGDTLNYEPFELDLHSSNEPTMFEIQFVQDGTMYRYGVEYDRFAIHKEWLFEKQEGQKEYNLFARVGSDFEISKTRFPEGIGKEDSTENNRLFLSLVAQLKGEKSKAVLNCFRTYNFLSGMSSEGYEGFTISMFKNHSEGYKQAIEFFHRVQLGFNDVIIAERKMPDSEVWGRLSDRMREQFKDDTFVETLTMHNVYNENGTVVSQTAFSKDDKESEGTKKIIEISGPVFDTLREGKVLVIDELDAKLHPLLTIHIVRLFMNKETNPNGAQLIFATHDTHLLNLDILRRDQIWFTEKDDEEDTDIYSLVEFRDENGVKVRNDRSIEKDYINGRYGAIPFIQ